MGNVGSEWKASEMLEPGDTMPWGSVSNPGILEIISFLP